ncbi:hypothetical protein GCM10023231_12690 [Olivibacter ginsenosidimutans]|uniref:Uncharacterized protein n=1 Tax=Olivibacter ginsenosidimutans TaxID=1176537 RepID=A0ABP9AUU9_9SPHI
MEWISKLALPEEEKGDGRLAVQQRFKLAMEFLAPLSGLINRCRLPHKRKTPLGQAMSQVLHGAIEGEYPEQYVNPAKVLLCKGALSMPLKILVIRMGELIRLEYKDPSSRLISGEADDEMIICVYNPELRIAGINDEIATRTDGKATIHLPVQLRNANVHVYALAHSRDWKRFSRSVYLGAY